MKHLLAILLALFLSLPAHAATLSRQNLGDGATGTEATYADATDATNDVVTNIDGNTLLHFKNPGANSATITVAAQDTSVVVPGYGTVSRADVVLALAAGEEGFVGPLPTKAFNNSSGQLTITYSGTGATDVTVAALKIQ